MVQRRIKVKKFKTQKQASDWAKKEKAKGGPTTKIKWETNRIDGDSPMKWEAVIFKNV